MIPLHPSRSRSLFCGVALLLTLQVLPGWSGAPPDPLTLDADMAIAGLTASPSPTVAAGGTITYTIEYVNNGPDTPGSTSVSDIVPIGTTFVSMRVVSGTGWKVISAPAVGGTGQAIWRKGDPGPGAGSGETAQFEIVVAVDAGLPNNRTISNMAMAYSIDPGTVDGTQGNDSKTVTTRVVSSVPSLNSDLAITSKTASPTPNVDAGAIITYTIDFVNSGPDTSGSASVKDTIPANTTFVSKRVVSGTGWIVISSPAAGGIGDVIWRKGYPGPGPASAETAQFEVVVAVNAGVINGTTISNTASTYSIDTATVDGTSSNNERTVSVNAVSGTLPLNTDLAITGNTASPTPNVIVGSTITYTIDFINNGPDTPGSASVKDTIPAHTTFVSKRVVSGTGWNVISSPSVGGTGDVIWRKGNPGPGPAGTETAQFEVVVTVDPATAHYTTISNTASTYSIDPATVDGTPANNSKTVTTKAMVVADPLEPNDTAATATVLPMGTTADLVISDGDTTDTDWYTFFVPPEDAGKDLKVNVKVTSPYPDPKPANWRSDLDFDLLDGSLAVRGTAISGSDNETLYLHNVASGWYYIFIGYSTTDYAGSAGYARYNITMETGTTFGVGYISGRVVDGNGQGIAQVFVSAYDVPLNWNNSFPTMTAGPLGNFSIAVTPGTHDLYFTGNGTLSPNQSAVNVVDEYYLDKATLATADHISVSSDQTQNLGDVTLDVGAIVSGHVTNTSGTALGFVYVTSYDLAGNSKSWVYTDASGNYRCDRVPVGGAKIRFSKGGYALEFYDDKPSLGAGSTLPTLSGVAITSIDAQLSAGGTMSGSVKDGLGSGLSINLRLYSVVDGTFSRASTTSSVGSGNFTFTNVKPGDYKIFFNAAGTSYAPEWYSDAASFALATSVTVAEGAPTSGINAVLAQRSGGDFTGDLKRDVLWRHATRGNLWLWPMNGAARTTETYVRTVADTDWEIRGLGDQTGDGKADILWRNKTTGQIYLWPMDGSTPLSETYVATVDPAYDIVGTGDYNGDGKSDILWRHLTNGEVWIWLMDGATPLIGGQVYVDTVDPAYVIKGSGDLNLDSKSDIVWHHATTGEVWVWLMNGTTRLSQTWVGTVPDVGYQIVGVADFDGNGKGDILWHHASRGEVWIWPMDGTTVLSQSYVDTVPDTGYEIVGSGDYNGDSKADILWHHATRGEVWVWLMDGTTKVSETWVATVPDVGYQIIR